MRRAARKLASAEIDVMTGNKLSPSIGGRLPEPKLSVVIVADGYDIIRKTVSHLRDQSIKDQLEIVIVAEAKERLVLEFLWR